MECKNIKICPSSTGWCNNKEPSADCVPFLLSANKNLKDGIEKWIEKHHTIAKELNELKSAEKQGLLIKRDCTGCKRILYSNGDCNLCVRRAIDFYEPEALKGSISQ